MAVDFLKSLSEQKSGDVITNVVIPSEDVCITKGVPEEMRITLKMRSLPPRMLETVTKRATERKIDRGKNRQETDLSEEKLAFELAKTAIIDWSVTVAQWRFWAPSNPPAFSDLDVQPVDNIPFSPELCSELARTALSLALSSAIIEEATNPMNFAPEELTTSDEIKN
jgi:hypothetical protein